jgi:hypothetical protein
LFQLRALCFVPFWPCVKCLEFAARKTTKSSFVSGDGFQLEGGNEEFNVTISDVISVQRSGCIMWESTVKVGQASQSEWEDSSVQP